MAKTEQGSSRMDTVLKMLLIAFVSLLAFSSGVYFGKQMSDSDHQLKALESDFNTQSYTAENSEGKAAPGEEGLADQEVAAISDKYLNGEKETKETAERTVASTETAPATASDEHAAPVKKETAEAHPAVKAETAAPAKDASHEAKPAAAAPAIAATHAAAAHTESKLDLSAAHRAAERVANNAAPIAPKVAAPVKPESARVPTSLPKTVGANNAVEFTVQVASYPTAAAAKERADELVKKGFPAFPVEAAVNGRTWYRVSVGSFKTMKDATTYRAQLLKQADLQNAIVQKITR